MVVSLFNQQMSAFKSKAEDLVHEVMSDSVTTTVKVMAREVMEVTSAPGLNVSSFEGLK